MNYDIIGDIHGCAKTLSALLDKLDYKIHNGIHHHPSRKVIFLGDFIDRGAFQKEVIDIVRPMIESGAALSVMGNHEFNAVAYYTKDNNGVYLREHNDKNIKQHKAFLDVYENNKEQYDDVIAWFKTLPLWLELDGLNIVHACWDKSFISRIKEEYNGGSLLTDEILIKASNENMWEFDAIETLLKGKEIPLPEGCSFKDKDGNPRHHIRVRWWDKSAKDYRSAFMGPETALTHIPEDEIIGDHLIDYSHDEPPVFLGHYWLEGKPEPLAINIACVDYSVAKAGKLVAYRWDGEQKLSSDKFIFVDRIEPKK